MSKQFYVYLMSNALNTVLYVGVTNNLRKRAWEHKNEMGSKFTKKYHVNKLVYYEQFDDAYIAISREKQIKAGSRKKKVELISKFNKEWKDLYGDL